MFCFFKNQAIDKSPASIDIYKFISDILLIHYIVSNDLNGNKNIKDMLLTLSKNVSLLSKVSLFFNIIYLLMLSHDNKDTLNFSTPTLEMISVSDRLRYESLQNCDQLQFQHPNKKFTK